MRSPKGDTLYDISKRLFGDTKYWPKIWALNNGKILNPHLILPGHPIILFPAPELALPGDQRRGSGLGNLPPNRTPVRGPCALPGVEASRSPAVGTGSTQASGGSGPARIDSRSRIKSAGPPRFRPADDGRNSEAPILWSDFRQRKRSEFISLQDLVFIHGEGDIHIGQTYSITTLPNKLGNQATEREGFVYPLLGKVKILQQREGAFVGIITNAKTPIERGAMLIPSEPKIPTCSRFQAQAPSKA